MSGYNVQIESVRTCLPIPIYVDAVAKTVGVNKDDSIDRNHDIHSKQQNIDTN